MKDKIVDAYSKLAGDYELYVDEESDANARYERPAMVKLMPENMSGMNVLDAGCAAGWYTQQFINRGAQVTAVDLTPEMVEATKRRSGDKATVFVHDLATPLPLADSTFDLIVSSLTLHYLDDWSLTFREFHRVLKPGGRLIFSVHHPFMDFVSFERPDYFAHELLHDQWKKRGAGQVEVVFFRRPLQEIMNQTAAYFRLEKLVEPQPDPDSEGEWTSPSWYQRLLTNPQFLIVAASKGALLESL